MEYTSLHGHTVFSDGFNTIEELHNICVQCGCVAIGITDHGTMGSTFPCVVQCPWDKGNVKFIGGLEGYHHHPSYTLEQIKSIKKSRGKQTTTQERHIFHITLLAANDEGYRNLCNINYNGWKNFYRYPLLDISNLGNTKGIICLTGCPSSYFVYLLLCERYSEARSWVQHLKSIFDTVYIEIMGGSDIHKLYEKQAMDIARETNTPVISTKDYHYDKPDNKPVYDALCLAKHKPVIGGDYALCVPPNTIAETEGIQNGIELATKVSYTKLPLSKVVTTYKPDQLWSLVRNKAKEIGQSYSERVEYEISVITDLDMGWYIAMLYEICQYMAKHGILYEARGSASGSLVCYLLGITCIDPVRHNMLFERFMSRSRREIPDIDLDVPSTMRSLIINELQKDWVVAKIITTNYVGENLAQQCYKRLVEKQPNTIIKPENFVGRVYNTGVHASGIVLIPRDTNVAIPIRHQDGWDIIEFETEHLPFVKWDLLGQKTLDVIQDTYRSVTPPEQHTLEYYLKWRDSIIYNDEQVYQSMLFAHECGTPGVFQMEGSMSHFFLNGSYWSLDDLSKLVAIYRPAVLMSPIAKSFLRGDSPDPVIAQCCRSGFPIYQEDLMNILHKVANIPLEDTYTIIKKTARKDPQAIDMVSTLLKKQLHDINPQRTQNIIDTVMAFTSYGFNVAHAVAYGVRMAVTAHLKYFYPHIYFSKLLNHEGDPKAIISYILHLQYIYNIKPTPAFTQYFQVVNNKLLVPVSAIKRVSVKDVPHIISGQGLPANKFVQHCLDFGVSANTIKGLDTSGFSQTMWGVRLLPRFEAIYHNRRVVRKKVPVPSDQPFDPKEQILDVGQYNQHIENAGTPLFPCPLPQMRIAWAPKQFLCNAVLFRSGNKYTIIDMYGEQYKLEGYACKETLKLIVGLPCEKFGSLIRVIQNGNQ